MATRKTTTSKTNCKLHCCAVTGDRAEEIRADARSGRRWAEEIPGGFGVSPACRCAVPQKGPFSVHGVDDGTCPRHPNKEK